MAFNTSSSQPFTAPNLVDSFIPGFSLISTIFAQYFHVDISSYVSYLIILLAVVALLNYSGIDLYQSFSDWFVSTAEIRLDDEMFNYVMYWISIQPFSARTPHFVAGTKTTSEFHDDERDEDDAGDDDNLDQSHGSNPQYLGPRTEKLTCQCAVF